MNITEVNELFNILTYNVRGFNSSKDMINSWASELSQYSAKEVFERVKELLAEKIFQTTTPTVYYIVKGLTKVKDKIDYSKCVYYCSICNKAYNSIEELHKHEDKCRSIRYIQQQCDRFQLNKPSKKELWELSDEDFEKWYNKLLKYVMDHTTDDREKTRIGFVFKLPSPEEAKKYLNGN